jgi:hypothetical protein
MQHSLFKSFKEGGPVFNESKHNPDILSPHSAASFFLYILDLFEEPVAA